MKGTLLKGVFAAVISLSGYADCAHARNDGAAVAQDQDKLFVQKASQVNLEEIKVGKLAQERGGSDATKEFGRMLQDDHSAANEALKSAAGNIPLASEPSAEQQATYSKLSKLSGSEFDKVFAKKMVKGHKDAIALFENEAKSKNVPLQKFASDMLPSLRAHLQHAESLYSK